MFTNQVQIPCLSPCSITSLVGQQWFCSDFYSHIALHVSPLHSIRFLTDLNQLIITCRYLTTPAYIIVLWWLVARFDLWLHQQHISRNTWYWHITAGCVDLTSNSVPHCHTVTGWRPYVGVQYFHCFAQRAFNSSLNFKNDPANSEMFGLGVWNQNRLLTTKEWCFCLEL